MHLFIELSHLRPMTAGSGSVSSRNCSVSELNSMSTDCLALAQSNRPIGWVLITKAMGLGPRDCEARVEVNSYSPVGIGALLVVDAFSYLL